MENVGSVHIRLQPNDRRSPPQLIKADVELSGATIFIILQRESKWPFRIENSSEHRFTLVQSVCAFPRYGLLLAYKLRRMSQGPPGIRRPRMRLSPNPLWTTHGIFLPLPKGICVFRQMDFLAQCRLRR
jgi:hypothetical protein